MEPAQTWRIWAGQQCAPECSYDDGDLDPSMNEKGEGHRECLWCTRDEAVGEKLGSDPVNRHTLNMGTIPTSPNLPPFQGGEGQARCRPSVPGWDGGSVVVRGWESQPHGEGRQVDLMTARKGTRDAKCRNDAEHH